MLTPVILRSALGLAVSLIAIVAYNVNAEKKRIGAPTIGAGFALVIVLMINRLSAFALAGTVFAQFMVSKGWANILRSKGLWYPTLLLIGMFGVWSSAILMRWSENFMRRMLGMPEQAVRRGRKSSSIFHSATSACRSRLKKPPSSKS